MTPPRNKTDGALAAIVNRWDTEDLLRARDEVNQIATTPGWDTIMHVVAEGREAATHRLVTGPVLDQAGYARAMGLLAGIDTIKEVADVIRTLADAREKKLEKVADAAERS